MLVDRTDAVRKDSLRLGLPHSHINCRISRRQIVAISTPSCTDVPTQRVHCPIIAQFCRQTFQDRSRSENSGTFEGQGSKIE
eukprot:4823649-Pyramimonas_sp.AAC.1